MLSGIQAADSRWLDKWPAPAKLNLMLRIVGRRADGYHLLQTVFQIIDVCDWLRFTPLAEDKVALANLLPGVAEQDDLTVRAASLLKEATGCKQGVLIEVEKNLPMGGGLGGGSSDAATVLVALNHLWGLSVPQEELMRLGLQLGADVPIFVYGRSAWGEGVGERLQAISLPECWAVVLKPDCHVNTKEIFCAPDLTRDSKPITIDVFTDGDLRNDCEAAVVARYPLIKAALEALSRHGRSRLTGTGACVFALFDDEAGANAAAEDLRRDWRVYVAKCQNASPLYQKIQTGC